MTADDHKPVIEGYRVSPAACLLVYSCRKGGSHDTPKLEDPSEHRPISSWKKTVWDF